MSSHHNQTPSENVADHLFALFQQPGQLLTSEQLQTIRASIDRVINYRATVGVLGKTGAGKSSLCNALFGRDVAEVSDVEACTRHPQEIDLAINNGKGISLLDVPGVGESEEQDEEYSALYRRLMPGLDLVLWVIKGDDRALSVDERIFRSIVRPLIQQRGIPVIFVISQIDKIEPCREWDWKKQCPGPYQTRNIEAKLASVRQLFKQPIHCVCAVSAEEGYGLVPLVETIVRQLPAEKKWGFTREVDPEIVSDNVRREAQQGLWGTVKKVASEFLCDVCSAISAAVGKLFGWW